MRSIKLVLQLSALCTVLQTQAHASCKNKIEIYANRSESTGIGAVVSVGTVGALLLETNPVTGFPMIAASGLIYWLKTKPKRMLQLLDDAQFCTGKNLYRLYLRYTDQNTSTPMNFSEFCNAIHQADLDETLCNQFESKKDLPTKRSILKFLLHGQNT